MTEEKEAYSVIRIPYEFIDNPPPNFEEYWIKYKRFLSETGKEK